MTAKTIYPSNSTDSRMILNISLNCDLRYILYFLPNQIPVEHMPCGNLTVNYDQNKGYTLKQASMLSAGTYKCEAKFRAHEEYKFFYVHFSKYKLTPPYHVSSVKINNIYIYVSGSKYCNGLMCTGSYIIY
jgi:hypothetical protein